MATATPAKPRQRRTRTEAADPKTLWANNLKEIRRKRGRSMTQERLASLISTPDHKVGQTTIAAIETGRISGRRYMYKIAAVLDVPVAEIFPHADFWSVAEAARQVGLSTTQLYRGVEKNGVPMFRIKGTNFVKIEDVLGAKLKQRVGPSLREQLHYFLTNNGPMTVSELTDEFGPYKSAEERNKRKNTVQVLLSRYDEFIADRSTYPAKWRFSERKLAIANNKKRRAKAA